ncbi:DUF2066 domain-containing protein [bacterium]|nr:DUF2066 domain-containing protein [bacterium]
MRRHFFTIVLLCAPIVDAHAASSLLSAAIPVADRSEASVTRATSEGLSSILVKVSGDETIVDNPIAAQAISNARERMSLYSYEGAGDTSTLFVQFDDSVIKDILRQSGATFWGESRPPVLLWLVVDEPYSRRFATLSQDSVVLSALADEFALRGINMRLPLHDLEDASNISTELAWQKVAPRIAEASKRYGTEHVLVGRWVPLTGGQIIADWLYFDGDISLEQQRQSTDVDEISRSVVDVVVDAMAARYAVKLDFKEAESTLRVAITGVVTLEDYRNVMKQLSDIEVLENAQVLRIDGDKLELTVSGVPDAGSLARLLPNRTRLALIEVADTNTLLLNWGQP